MSHGCFIMLSLPSVAGLGYGIISGLFAMVNVLADITGPGSMGLHGDPQNFLIVSGKY